MPHEETTEAFPASNTASTYRSGPTKHKEDIHNLLRSSVLQWNAMGSRWVALLLVAIQEAEHEPAQGATWRKEGALTLRGRSNLIAC